MFFRLRSHHVIALVLALFVTLFCAAQVRAQDDEEFGDDAADPVQLFKRGQEAHQRGAFEQALALYDAALKVRPEFPEALYQRGNALVSLSRFADAEKSFQRAIELRADWALPRASLGALLLRLNRLDEAEKHLKAALELEKNNAIALAALIDLRLRSKPEQAVLVELLGLLERATASEDATPSLWVARASVERALGKRDAAFLSLDNALRLDPKNIPAFMERAEAHIASGNFEQAIAAAQAARAIAPSSVNVVLLLAHTFALAGKSEEAVKVLDSLDEAKKRLPEVVAMREKITAASVPETDDIAALEKLAGEQPRNAPLQARLCVLYRAVDASRALAYCRRALELEVNNADYATAYGAALVKAQHFGDAIRLLRRVIENVPDNYTAHANLATALYEMKLYNEALVEFGWIARAKPELAITYFFMAIAYDQTGQFPQALAAYEKFLERADPGVNQLEIDKVRLRLPTLRNQIKRGEGVKSKKGE